MSPGQVEVSSASLSALIFSLITMFKSNNSDNITDGSYLELMLFYCPNNRDSLCELNFHTVYARLESSEAFFLVSLPLISTIMTSLWEGVRVAIPWTISVMLFQLLSGLPTLILWLPLRLLITFMKPSLINFYAAAQNSSQSHMLGQKRPWITHKLKNMTGMKNKLYHKYKRKTLADNRDAYCVARNRLNNALQKSQETILYYSTCLTEQYA